MQSYNPIVVILIFNICLKTIIYDSVNYWNFMTPWSIIKLHFDIIRVNLLKIFSTQAIQ